MAIWVKPSGQEIELNEKPATIEYAKSLKWKPKKKEVKKAKPQAKE